MYPAALHRFPTQLVALSQIFEKSILSEQPNIIKQLTKSWDKNTITDLDEDCPQQKHDFPSW